MRTENFTINQLKKKIDFSNLVILKIMMLYKCNQTLAIHFNQLLKTKFYRQGDIFNLTWCTYRTVKILLRFRFHKIIFVTAKVFSSDISRNN